MVRSLHVIFSTTKFHSNRNMDNTFKFAVMKTRSCAIMLTMVIYITHVHLFGLFSEAVPSSEELPLNYTLKSGGQECHLVDGL